MPDETPNGSADLPDSSPVSGLPAAVAEAISGMRDELPTEAELAGHATPENDADAGRPADATAARGSQSDGDDSATDGDDTSSDQGEDDAAAAEQAVEAGGSEDEADLAQYPERVREAFKSLSRTQRKALYEQAAEKAREAVTVERERADRLETERKADEAKREEIRTTMGRFIGQVPTTAPNGQPIPTYDELASLLTSRNGYQVLADRYAMSEDDARVQKEVWDERREMLGSTADHLEDQAWGKLGTLLKQGLQRVEGVDPEAIVTGAAGPHDVVSRLAKAISDRYEGQIAKLTKDYEGRLESLRLNGEAQRGRSAARTPAPVTGGRSGGGPRQLPTKPGDILALPDKDFAAIEDELLALIK